MVAATLSSGAVLFIFSDIDICCKSLLNQKEKEITEGPIFAVIFLSII